MSRSDENDALRERITRAIIEHADHMETYTLPTLQPGFIDGWTHALRLLRRDAGFIAHHVFPPGECDNYRPPLTCLTAPSSETGRCDKCRTRPIPPGRTDE